MIERDEMRETTQIDSSAEADRAGEDYDTKRRDRRLLTLRETVALPEISLSGKIASKSKYRTEPEHIPKLYRNQEPVFSHFCLVHLFRLIAASHIRVT